MRIPTEKVLLALMGFLHFRRADGMVPNDPSNFPERHILIKMEDRCIAAGRLGNADNAPNWLQPNQAHPRQFQFYIRTRDHQFEGLFNPLVPIIGGHDPLLHTTPKSVQIHVLHGEYYIAGPFEVLTQQLLQHLRQQPGLFPPVDYLYVTVPEGEMHRAPLQRQWYQKYDERLGHMYPGLSQKPGMISRIGDYLLRIYHSH